MSSRSAWQGSRHSAGMVSRVRVRGGSMPPSPALAAFWGLLLLVLPTVATGAQEECLGAVARAETLYGDGRYEEARSLLVSCCDSLDSGERFDCLRLLLASLTLLGDHRQASETAEAMIALDPRAELRRGSVPRRARVLHDSLRTALVGGMSVVSTPTGAGVTFDGDALGLTTPWRGYAVRGRHEIRLSKQGYRDEVLEVEIVPGVLELVTATLTPALAGELGRGRTELWRSSLVPGWGQIRTGKQRGWAYTAGVLSAGLVSSLSYGKYASAVNDYNAAVDRGDKPGATAAYDDAKKARGAWLTWAGIAVGIHALNVIDAWLF